MTEPRGVEDDPFAVLGVSRDCTPSQLKQAYRLLARRYHPDVNPGPEAAAQMSRINLAYDRALRQLERTARIRAFRAATVTVTNRHPHTPPVARAETSAARPEKPVTRPETPPPARSETPPPVDSNPKVPDSPVVPDAPDVSHESPLEPPGGVPDPAHSETPPQSQAGMWTEPEQPELQQTRAETPPQPSPEVQAQPETHSQAQVEVEAQAATEAQPQPETHVEAGMQTETPPQPQAEVETETRAAAQPEAETQADTETQAETQAQANTQPQPQPHPQAEAETQVQIQPKPPTDGAAPSPIRVAHALHGTTRRVTQRASQRAFPRRGVWMSVAAGSTVAALVIFYIAHALQMPSHTSARTHSHSPAASPATIQLGGAIAVAWDDSGSLSISDRLLMRFSSGMRLNEPPQWSRDGTYTTVSMSPSNSGANSASTLAVVQGTRVLTSVAGASGRWSPVANQLAVVTEPGPSSAPQLELVSPSAPESPAVLDTHAGTHLAWSDDGTQIAYTADGQQQLRVASIADGSHQIVLRARGQRLVPVGWRNGQIVEIVHHGGAVSLTTVDPVGKQSEALADVDDTATEATVAVSRGGVAYVSQPPARPQVTFYWSSARQQWQAQIPDIQTVRFLAGWSADGTWMALAPVPSSSQTSEICLARAPQPGALPPTQWTVHCLRLPGVLAGMSWEPQFSTLSYIRATSPGGALELRELRIQSAQTRTSGDTVDTARLGSLGPLVPALVYVLGLGFIQYGGIQVGASKRYLVVLFFKGDP